MKGLERGDCQNYYQKGYSYRHQDAQSSAVTVRQVDIMAATV